MRRDTIGWQTPWRCALNGRTDTYASRHHEAHTTRRNVPSFCQPIVLVRTRDVQCKQFHGKGLLERLTRLNTKTQVTRKDGVYQELYINAYILMFSFIDR